MLRAVLSGDLFGGDNFAKTPGRDVRQIKAANTETLWGKPENVSLNNNYFLEENNHCTHSNKAWGEKKHTKSHKSANKCNMETLNLQPSISKYFFLFVA